MDVRGSVVYPPLRGSILAGVAAIAGVMSAGSAFAATQLPVNVGPPSGGRVVIDMVNRGLDKTETVVGSDTHIIRPVPTTAIARFTAQSTQTRLSLEMRADLQDFTTGQTEFKTGAEMFIDNVFAHRIDPVTNGVLGGDVLSNENFEANTSGAPAGWIVDAPAGASAGAVELNPLIPPPFPIPDPSLPQPVNHSFQVFANDEYGAISQTFATIPGATYEVAFTVAIIDFNPPLIEINTGTGQVGNDIDTTHFLQTAEVDGQGRQIADGLDAILVVANAGPGFHDDGHVHFLDEGGGGVPEPATWGLMILGLGGVGSTLRRRRSATLSV